MFDVVSEEGLGYQSCGLSRWMGQRRGISGGTNNHKNLRKEMLIAAATAPIATARKGPGSFYYTLLLTLTSPRKS